MHDDAVDGGTVDVDDRSFGAWAVSGEVLDSAGKPPRCMAVKPLEVCEPPSMLRVEALPESPACSRTSAKLCLGRGTGAAQAAGSA